jgi:hypothetical protein
MSDKKPVRMRDISPSGQKAMRSMETLARLGLLPQEAHPDLESMPYEDYLLTAHWKQLRAEALGRAEQRCQLCNSDVKPLHVHHRTYARRGHERLEDLTVLCSECHQLFHDHGRLK